MITNKFIHTIKDIPTAIIEAKNGSMSLKDAFFAIGIGGKAAFLGIGAAIGIAIVAFQKYRQEQQEYQDSLKETISTAEENIQKYEGEIDSLEKLQGKLKEAKGDKAALFEISSELNTAIGETIGLLNNESDAYDVANTKINARIASFKNLVEEEKNARIWAQKEIFKTNTTPLEDVPGGTFLDWFKMGANVDIKEASQLLNQKEQKKEIFELIADEDIRDKMVGSVDKEIAAVKSILLQKSQEATAVFQETIASVFADAESQGYINDYIQSLIFGGEDDLTVIDQKLDAFIPQIQEFNKIKDEFLTKKSTGENTDGVVEDLETMLNIVETFVPENAEKMRSSFATIESATKDGAGDIDEFANSIKKLNSISDGFSTLSQAMDEMDSEGLITIDTISEINEKFANVEGLEDYINTLLTAKKGSKELDDALSGLTYGLIDTTYTTEELANAEVEHIANMLEAEGVSNSLEVATYAVSVAKEKVRLESEGLSNATADEIVELLNEEGQSAYTRQALIELAREKVKLNSTEIDTEDDVEELLKIATAAKADIKYLNLLKIAKQQLSEDFMGPISPDVQSVIDGTYKVEWEDIESSAPRTNYISDAAQKAADKAADNAKKMADAADTLAEKEADIAEKLADAEKDFAEKMAEWEENNRIETFKEELQKRQDALDKYEKSLATYDFGLDLIDEENFDTQTQLLNSKLMGIHNQTQQLRNEFSYLLSLNPQSGEEAQAVADMVEGVGEQLKENLKLIKETQDELFVSSIDNLTSYSQMQIDALEYEIDRVQSLINILENQNANNYGKYSKDLLFVDAFFNSMSIGESEAVKEQAAEDEAMIELTQETQDTINEIVTDALNKQIEDSRDARAEERQEIIDDFEETKADLMEELEEARADYNEKLREIQGDVAQVTAEIRDDTVEKTGYIRDDTNGKLVEMEDQTGTSTANMQASFESAVSGMQASADGFSTQNIISQIENVIEAVDKMPKNINVNVDSVGSGSSNAGNNTSSNADNKTNNTSYAGGGNLPISPGANVRISETYAGHKARGSAGIDIAAPSGTPIYATTDGTVTTNSYDGRSGNYVIITDADGTQHGYMHMKSPSSLTNGSKVSVGQVIGYVGSTGNSTGPHLHYQTKTANGHVNPGNYVALNAYADGTRNAEGGWSLVGEEGYEIMIVPGENGAPSQAYIVGADGMQLLNIPAGVTILTHEESEKALKGETKLPATQMYFDQKGFRDAWGNYLPDTKNFGLSLQSSNNVEGLIYSTLLSLERGDYKDYNAENAVPIRTQMGHFTGDGGYEYNHIWDGSKGFELIVDIQDAVHHEKPTPYRAYIVGSEGAPDAEDLPYVQVDDLNHYAGGRVKLSHSEATKFIDSYLIYRFGKNRLSNFMMSKGLDSPLPTGSGFSEGIPYYIQNLIYGNSTKEMLETVFGGGIGEEIPEDILSYVKLNELLYPDLYQADSSLFPSNTTEEKNEESGDSVSKSKDESQNNNDDWLDKIDALKGDWDAQISNIMSEYRAELMKLHERKDEMTEDEQLFALRELEDKLYESLGRVGNEGGKVIFDAYMQWESDVRAGLAEDSVEIREAWVEAFGDFLEYAQKADEYINDKFLNDMNDGLSEINRIISRIVDSKEKEIELLNKQIERRSGLMSVEQRYYDATNKLTDAQHEADKAIAETRIGSKYLTDAEYEGVYSEEDYKKETAQISKIQNDINDISEKFYNRINDLEDDELYLIESMTAEYNRQIEAKERELEIVQAEIDLQNKQNQLNNILSEKNVRMIKDGHWTWTFNHDRALEAQNAVSDAEYAFSRAKENDRQQDALDKSERFISDKETEIGGINAEITALQDSVKALDLAVEDATDPIKKIGYFAEVFANYGISSLNDAFNGLLSMLSQVTGEDYGYINPAKYAEFMGNRYYDNTQGYHTILSKGKTRKYIEVGGMRYYEDGFDENGEGTTAELNKAIFADLAAKGEDVKQDAVLGEGSLYDSEYVNNADEVIYNEQTGKTIYKRGNEFIIKTGNHTEGFENETGGFAKVQDDTPVPQLTNDGVLIPVNNPFYDISGISDLHVDSMAPLTDILSQVGLRPDLLVNKTREEMIQNLNFYGGISVYEPADFNGFMVELTSKAGAQAAITNKTK